MLAFQEGGETGEPVEKKNTSEQELELRTNSTHIMTPRTPESIPGLTGGRGLFSPCACSPNTHLFIYYNKVQLCKKCAYNTVILVICLVVAIVETVWQPIWLNPLISITPSLGHDLGYLDNFTKVNLQTTAFNSQCKQKKNSLFKFSLYHTLHRNMIIKLL